MKEKFMQVEQYKVIELSFTSEKTYTTGFETELFVEFTCGDITKKIRAFWDGGNNWKVRFSPEILGQWVVSTTASRDNVSTTTENGDKLSPTTAIPGNAKPQLGNNNNISFQSIPYEGNNPLYKHGSLKLSESKTHIVHADDTPFFWLADTAWNGVIRSDEENWQKYLDKRVEQRFTAIQYVSSQWRGNALDLAGEAACTETTPIAINPDFFKRIDKKVAMINDAGLIASPVAIWTLIETDPGIVLSEEDCIKLAKYIVARYDAYQVIWFLGGDGDYLKTGVDKRTHIGTDAFEYRQNRIVTLHTCGVSWPNEFFRDEKWYSFMGYQSGHSDSEHDIKWLTVGPPSTEWKNRPTLPVINLEPNYEDAHGYAHNTFYTDYHVRRAAYWSLLVSPTAGVTYGHDSIWNWNFETGPSEGHGNWGDGKIAPWYTALETEGLNSMKIMRDIFDTIVWTTLTPAQELLNEQPGDSNPISFVAVAQNKNNIIMIYSPCGGTVSIKCNGQFKIINPKTGETVEVQDCNNSIIFPDSKQDWLAISSC
jgi:hypothetical protein